MDFPEAIPVAYRRETWYGTLMDEVNDLQKHLAKLIMPQVEEFARKKNISRHAAYYLFLGIYPGDETAFTARELEILDNAIPRPKIKPC